MLTFAEINLAPGGVIGWVIVGLIAGALAGYVMKGRGYGLIGDLFIGLVGAVVGGLVFGMMFEGTTGLVGSIVVAFLGACGLIMVVRALASRRTDV